MGKRMWNDSYVFPFPFWGGNSWLFPEASGRGMGEVPSPALPFPHIFIVWKTQTWVPRAEEAMQKKHFCKQVLGRRKMWPAEGTWGKFHQGWRNGRNKEGKIMRRSQHWKGWGAARGMVYLLTHIKTSLKAERNINSNHNYNEEFIADDTTGSHRSFWKLKIIASFWVWYSLWN